MKLQKFGKLFGRGIVGLIVAFVVFWIWAMPKSDIRGVWLTEGYGLVAKITPFTIDIREVSALSCERFELAPANLWLVKTFGGLKFDREGTRLVIQSDETINPIYADRIEKLPDTCTTEAEQDKNDPVYNYDVFWTAFDEHYSFFDLYGVYWQEVRASIRPTITRETSEDALFAAMKESISGLDDGHTYIFRENEGYTASTPHPWEENWREFLNVAESQADSPLVLIDGSGIKYGLINERIGLISILHMEVEKPLGKSAPDFARIVAQEFARNLADTDAIIVDIRFNGGGSDNISLAYAGAFTNELVLAFSKTTRSADGFTAPTEAYIQPASGARLSQPVYLLTSGMSASAAEIFTFAMRELPQVTVIGEPTTGAHSDIHSRNLPNGWGLGLSHQIYRDPDGNIYEGVGIPPDILREMDGEAFLQERDTLMQEVIGLIEG